MMFERNETINQHIRNKVTVIQCMVEYARKHEVEFNDEYFQTLVSRSQQSINSLCELGNHIYESPFSRYYDTITVTEKRPEGMELSKEQYDRLKIKNDVFTEFFNELMKDLDEIEQYTFIKINPSLKMVYDLGAEEYRHYLEERKD